MNLSVIGAIIIRSTIFLIFKEYARKEVSTEQAAVERLHLLVGGALYEYTAEELVPRRCCTPTRSVEVAVLPDLLLPRQAGLLGTDVRRSRAYLHLRAGLELQPDARAVALFTQHALADGIRTVIPHAASFKRFIELHVDMATPCRAVVDPCDVVHPSANRPRRGVDGPTGVILVAIDNHPGILALGERKAEMSTTLGRSHLRAHAIVESNRIVVGMRRLIIMAKGSLTFLFAHTQTARDGHEGEPRIVAHPRAALVGLTEAANGSGAIGVFPSVAIAARLC